MTHRRTWTGALAALYAGACGGRESAARAPDGTASSTPGSAARLATRPGGPTGQCPHDGRWRVCSLVDRLDKAGLVPHVDTTAAPERLAFLHAPGTVVHLGLGELHTFVYDDTAALARDVAALDTTRVAPRGQTYTWSTTPTLVRSANLLAVLLTPNERQIERIQLALEAGPPQARSAGVAGSR
ncbi:hypothetical protein tb265_19840 [Gemmatimonadetes bacterium T265]|nr:hypothetical protein tb265_19840 [Gemmatimonadetes bacterium T265]